MLAGEISAPPFPMQNQNDSSSFDTSRAPMPGVEMLSGAFGIASLFVTFFTAASELPFIVKAGSFAGIVLINMLILSLTLKRFGNAAKPTGKRDESEVSDDISVKLSALDDANEFFGGSLKSADMFRLVSSRVAEILPFSASAFFVPDEASGGWRVEYSDGRNSESIADVIVDADDGLTGKAVSEGAVTIDPELLFDIGSLPAEFLNGLRSAAALPLARDGRVFGVFQIYSETAIAEDDRTHLLLESVAERLAPLFLNSMAFERSLANAFTDSLTNLPNERAFYMILENQLAESQRYRDERPITVLAIDIESFAEVNSAFGHATGDHMLVFVAEGIRGQLRKMDFLSRSANDEFLVILPGASETIANEIVERIKANFASNSFEVSDDETIKIWLNFGSATFWKDGETAQQLLKTANVRKRQSKLEESNKVLWFPKEYVN